MAIRQKTVITVNMQGQASSHSLVEVGVRDLASKIDEPLERGGTNPGFSPTETMKYCAIFKLYERAGTNLDISWRKT